MTVPPGRKEPPLSELLLALADSAAAGVLGEAAGRLGLTPERLESYLRESAELLSPYGPTRPLILSQSKDAAQAALPLKVPHRPRAGAGQPAFEVLEVFSDGAARGNPGPAGAGAVVRTVGGRVVAREGKFLGVQTNNVAEYEGLLLGLRKALDLGAREVHVFSDSMLVVSQLDGSWKIKHPGLRPLYDRARALLAKFDRTALAHVPREKNAAADEMSNRAIDERM